MRLAIVKTIFTKELREMLRDRRSLLVMFGLPLVLYPVLALVIAGLGASKEQQYTQELARVAVHNGDSAPHLIDLIRKDKDQFVLVEAPDAKVALAHGDVNAVLTVPSDFQSDLLTDQPPGATQPAHPANHNASRKKNSSSIPGAPASAPTTEPDDRPTITVDVDRSRSDAPFVENKINDLLDQYDQWIVAQRLEAHHLTTDILTPPPRDFHDIATSEQRFGKILAVMLPLLLLMTGMLGAMFPALHATTTERELGTLETLLVTPASRMELLAAKGLLVLLSGLLTAGLNMTSMSLVLWRAYGLMHQQGAPLAIDVPTLTTSLILSYVAAVPALLFFSTLVLIVGLVARNYREANSFATPVMLLPLAAGFVAMAEPPSSATFMITPVVNTTLIIRDVLTGRIVISNFLLAFASSTIYAGLMLSLAIRLFSNEQLVNPSWEPVSFKFARGRKRPRRLPNVDGAIALFCLCILLELYLTPMWIEHYVLRGIVGTLVLFIAAPTLLWAVFARYRWRETFSLYVPTVLDLTGATLIGVGLIPVVTWLQTAQNIAWHPSPGGNQLNDMIQKGLQYHPILLPLLAGLFAGICEELLFRGVIQTAFLRRFPVWFALSVTALLFSLAHFDLHGTPLRFFLGLALGWIVYRRRSLYPAILTHALFDAVQLGWLSWQINHPTAAALTQAATAAAAAESLPEFADLIDAPTLMQLAIGIAAAFVGFIVLARQRQRNFVPPLIT